MRIKHQSMPALNPTLLFGSAILLAGFAAAIPAHAASSDESGSSSAMARSVSAPLSSQDREFMTQAGAANLAEIRMGELAMKKGATAATREYGRWMITDHGMAAREMAVVARRMDPAAAQPVLTGEQKAQYRKLEGLSGARFDQAYLQAMVRSHEMTMKIFQQEASGGQNLLIKGFAMHMIPPVREHLTEAEELTKSR